MKKKKPRFRSLFIPHPSALIPSISRPLPQAVLTYKPARVILSIKEQALLK